MSDRMNLLTPCHGAPIFITTRMEGHGYLTTDVPDEIWCSYPGCQNTWDATGKADLYNKMSDPGAGVSA